MLCDSLTPENIPSKFKNLIQNENFLSSHIQIEVMMEEKINITKPKWNPNTGPEGLKPLRPPREDLGRANRRWRSRS